MKDNKLQDSTSNEIKISNSQETYSISGTKRKCYKLLFSCFKIARKEESQKNSINDQFQECEYFVEKLLVKRVPDISFNSQKNPLESDLKRETEKLLTTVERNVMFSSGPETQSLIYYCDKLSQNIPIMVPNKCLYFGTDINTLYEGNETNMLTIDYNAKMKELINTSNSLDPDLKKDEKPCNDQYSLNIPKSKTIFNPNSFNAKDNIQQHIKLLVNNELQHNWKSSVNKSEVLPEKTAKIDPSNITLRWKLILKQYKSKTP